MMATNVPKAKTSISVGSKLSQDIQKVENKQNLYSEILFKKNAIKRNMGKEVCFMESTS